MISYNALLERVYELSQIVVALAALGIAACVALYILWGRYETFVAFIKDDGLQGRYAEYRVRRDRAARLRRGQCPDHGGNLMFYSGRCPVKDCKTGKEE